MKSEQYLDRLIGKVLIDAELITATLVPINGIGRELFTIANSLHFEDYRLTVNNPMIIRPSDRSLKSLLGLKIIATMENEQEAQLTLDNGSIILIDLRDEAYFDPEAMVLKGPNNFCAIWQ